MEPTIIGSGLEWFKLSIRTVEKKRLGSDLELYGR
jgi:hypothetical protein